MKSAKFVGVLILLIIIDVTMAKFGVVVTNKKQEIIIKGFTHTKKMGENGAEIIFKPDDVLLLKGVTDNWANTVLVDVIKISKIESWLKYGSQATIVSGRHGEKKLREGDLKKHLNDDTEGEYWDSRTNTKNIEQQSFRQWIEKKDDPNVDNIVWKDYNCGTGDPDSPLIRLMAPVEMPRQPGAGGIGKIDNHLRNSGTHSLAHRESHNMLDQFGAHNHHYDDREDYEQRQFVAPYLDHSYNHDHYYNNDNAKDLNGLSDSNNNNINTMLIIIVIGLLMIIIGCIGCLFSGVIGTAIGHFLTKRSNQQSYVDRYNKMNGVDEEI